MELTLTSGDLRPECQHAPCSATKFRHFTDEAQAAVRIAGRARFETNGGSNYNAIHPPGRPPKGRVATFPPEDRPCGDCGFVHNESFCPRCEGDGEEDLVAGPERPARRNWRIEAKVGGVQCANREFDGGFELTVRQRRRGRSEQVLAVRGVTFEDGRLQLVVRDPSNCTTAGWTNTTER
jgi:hypothetical protein